MSSCFVASRGFEIKRAAKKRSNSLAIGPSLAPIFSLLPARDPSLPLRSISRRLYKRSRVVETERRTSFRARAKKKGGGAQFEDRAIERACIERKKSQKKKKMRKNDEKQKTHPSPAAPQRQISRSLLRAPRPSRERHGRPCDRSRRLPGTQPSAEGGASWTTTWGSPPPSSSSSRRCKAAAALPSRAPLLRGLRSIPGRWPRGTSSSREDLSHRVKSGIRGREWERE